MKNFRRAIRDSFHFWPSILLATVCSFGVAALWGGNIGALLPVIEMTLRSESSQEWFENSIAKSEEKLSLLKAEQETTGIINPEIADEEFKLSWNRYFLNFARAYLPTDPFTTICWIMGLLIFTTLVKHLLMMANDLIISRVSTSIVRSLRLRVFERALSLDRRKFDSYGTSGLLATITNTAETLSAGLMNFFGAAVREPLRIISCLVLASLICWRLLLLSLILAPALIWIVTYFNRKMRSVGSTIFARNARFHEVILEALNNVFTVQAYNMESSEQKRFESCTRDMQRCSMRMTLYSSLSKPFTELIGVAMIAITVCAGAYLIVNQQTHIFFVKICNEPMTLSKLLIFFGLLVGASDPLRKLSGVFTSIYRGTIAADTLYGMLDYQVALKDPDVPVPVPSPHSLLELKEVTFYYNKTNPVLNSVNLSVPFGKTIAIIGANGSGKSTLIQLLGRYHDPLVGSISLNGVDYRQLSLFDLRRRIALVSQTTELFNRTVVENIQYGSPDATEEEAMEAAKLAHAHDFIVSSLSDGYQTKVGQSGQRLSGGQRQRIALARAILRRPEILILDESTSQIDMASELQIRETLKAMKGRFTIIIITHREALIALSDATYEMRDGVLNPIQNAFADAA
jgi:ATP-binding cassette subfamily B protein/subfamily B ATP-binding cassette protein MsbA